MNHALGKLDASQHQQVSCMSSPGHIADIRHRDQKTPQGLRDPLFPQPMNSVSSAYFSVPPVTFHPIPYSLTSLSPIQPSARLIYLSSLPPPPHDNLRNDVDNVRAWSALRFRLRLALTFRLTLLVKSSFLETALLLQPAQPFRRFICKLPFVLVLFLSYFTPYPNLNILHICEDGFRCYIRDLSPDPPRCYARGRRQDR
jgi:hypothetical protein